MATHNRLSLPPSDGSSRFSQASLRFTSADPPVDKKRIPVGVIEVDTYPPAELTDLLVYNSLTSESTRHVVTANAQFYVMAERLRRFRKCLERAEYVCADGFSIQLACSLLEDQIRCH